MQNFQIMMPSEYKSMPWKNGLGKTLEMQRSDDQYGLRYRISQASVVQNGLFSDFTGLQRTLVLLSGDGMTLVHQNLNRSQNMHTLLDIAQFSGADKTSAKLISGSIEDLNIMVRESDTRANISIIDVAQMLSFSDSQKLLFTAFYAHVPCCINFNANTTDQQPYHLAAGSLLYCRDGQDLKEESILIKSDSLLLSGKGVMIEIFSK
ncbi:MAG: HutD family protein [Psychromonas sp.]